MEQKKDRRAVGVKVLPEGVEEYCERHTTALTELHERLLHETEEKTTTANFLVGEMEGAFLKMLVRMTQAKRILEVGMFTGYSALSFAEALPADGSIITCELDPNAIDIARRFFAQSPHARKIEIREGRAAETLKNLQGPFDLCFIDADKPSYDYYYNRCVELTRKGGLIVLDNMLRYGRVLNPTEEDARIVNALNDRIHNDPQGRKRSVAVSRRHHAGLQTVAKDIRTSNIERGKSEKQYLAHQDRQRAGSWSSAKFEVSRNVHLRDASDQLQRRGET